MPGHEQARCTPASPVPRSPRVWSHAALQQAELCAPLRRLDVPAFAASWADLQVLEAQLDDAVDRGLRATADRLERRIDRALRTFADPRPAPTLYVPQLDGSVCGIDGPAIAQLAAWAHRTPPTLSPQALKALLSHAEHERLLQLHTALHLYSGNDTREETDADEFAGRRAKALLGTLLHAGLQLREGQRLDWHDEVVYMHLICRGLSSPLRACEICLRVHPSKRAISCWSCNRSPPRPRPKPWHTNIALADRGATTYSRFGVITTAQGSTLHGSLSVPRQPAVTTYTGTCESCGTSFTATDAQQRYCPACGTPKARTVRHRATIRKPRTSSATG